MATLNFALQNKTTSNTVYAYVTGQAIDNNNALFLLQADGKTPYYPTSPSSTGAPLASDCAIPLGAPNATTTITIPHLAGARLWFVVNDHLTFQLNPGTSGPALVEPSVTNSADPNANKTYGFCEFTWNSSQFYGNISYVDFVCLPISLTLEATNAATQHVSGTDQNGLATVVNALKAQDDTDHAGWSTLIVADAAGAPLRVLSPNNGKVANPNLFANYFDPYVQQVWDMYTSQSLTVDTQAAAGSLTGKVDGTGNLVFQPGDFSFAKPSSTDIFGCSTGPFQTGQSTVKDGMIPRLAAAFNRSELLTNTTIPAAKTANGGYYSNAVTNHYSKAVHEANLDGRGYAFPYDDVTPTGGQDQSGAVHAGSPTLLTVAVGGNGAFVGDDEGTS